LSHFLCYICIIQNMNTFRSQITVHQINNRLSNEQLAEKAGISTKELWRLKNTPCNPRLSTAVRLCLALEVSISDLFLLKVKSTPNNSTKIQNLRAKSK